MTVAGQLYFIYVTGEQELARVFKIVKKKMLSILLLGNVACLFQEAAAKSTPD
jgi:hypothetical protein